MSSTIHPSAVIDKNAEIEAGVVIGPNCVIGSGCKIGEGTVLEANVVFGKNVITGKKNHFFPNAVIGMEPQLLGLDPDKPIGGLVIGDNNVIRENVTIHPGMYPDNNTTLGNGNLIMIGVHLGHDCVVEDSAVISNYSQISGHGKIETGVWISGVVAVHQFVTFGKWCYAAGFAGVNHDVPPFVIVSGHYPPEVRTLNKRGMKRAGLSDEQQHAIETAFRRIYRGNDGVFIDRVKAVLEENSRDENISYFCEFILRSSEHRFGRYLENFRH